jgi:tripartite-type tricarboxylate transporter receptor subunit TctC
MKLLRRQFLHLAAGAAALALSSRIARTDTYPSRPVRWIVPYPPGGPTDIAARLMGQWLSERLGQAFVIENRPGGAANIGTEAVVRSPPDGYTLLLVSGVHAINATLFDKLNYNFIRDIVPIAGILRAPGILLVNPSVPAKTVPEFIAYAMANPGKINFATSGNGSPGHILTELFKMMTGLNLPNVPYRGDAPAVADLLGGQVQAWFGSPAVSIEYIKAGRLRGLGVSTAARSELLPDLPTIAETVPGYEGSSWFGVGAPRGTPADIVDKLNREINLALADPRMKARFADLSGTALPGSPADFSKLIAEETEKFGKVIKFANIKPD